MKKKYLRGKHTRKRFEGKLNKKKVAILIILLIVFVFCVIIIQKNKETSNEIDTSSFNTVDENSIINGIDTNEIVNEVDLKEIVDVDMPDKIENYNVIGQIVIDEIDMKNYILDRTTDYSLNLAVTKFYGPDLNQRGNFCITGHNARGLFNNLKKLDIGDTFYIIDKENSEKVTYRIYNKETISPTDLDCLNQDTNNKREVTLITCNTRRLDKTCFKSKRGIEFAPQNTKNKKFKKIREDKKMKTKILGAVTIVTLLLMMLVTSVNAAEFTADKTEMQKGDIVTLTITTESEVESMQFDIAYDTTKYQYVENSATSALEATSSRNMGEFVRVSAFSTSGSTTNTITLQFEALENGEQIPFTISNTEFGLGADAVEETFGEPTINITIADQEPTDPENPGDIEDPTTPEDPGDTEDPTTPNEPSNPDDNKNEQNGSKDDNNSGEYVDENGNEITRLPQTGSLAPAIVAGVAILAVISIVVFKAIKK